MASLSTYLKRTSEEIRAVQPMSNWVKRCLGVGLGAVGGMSTSSKWMWRR